MVTKEQLVCSKEQSIKLLKKGIPKKSLFAWTEHKDQFGTLNLLDDNIGEGYPAFTTPELLSFLPKMNLLQRVIFYLKTEMQPDRVADYVYSRV